MARPRGRGQPPLIGLADLHAEIVRFRAAPRRRGGLAPEHDSPVGSAQRHVPPSTQPRLGTAPQPNPEESDPTGDGKGSVPRPSAPPSGPLSIVDGRATEPAAGGGTPESPTGAPAIPAPVTPNPDVPDETVAELVARAQSGEAEAFGALYDRYLELVYRYIYYRVGGVALAEDLASETFLRALRRIDSFSWQGRDFAAWLVTIARNLIADHYKSGRYRLEITTEDILEAAPHQAADGPENQVLDALTNETLLEAVRSLNPEQQECIVLRFLQGLSVSETALVMGKNDGAIKALQYRAVRALARLLPEEKLR
jgi:RNA polymerase sigma-70 factor (ECF subfamily)